MRKDFQKLSREIYKIVADGVSFPALNELHDQCEARRSAGMQATQRARYIAQYVPVAGGTAFLKACGVRNA